MSDLAAWLHGRLDSGQLKAETLKAGAAALTPAYPQYAALAVELADLMLADVDAKRRIIAEHGNREIASLEPATWGQPFVVCARCRGGVDGELRVVAPCPTLRLLALPFAEHEGYSEEWKP